CPGLHDPRCIFWSNSAVDLDIDRACSYQGAYVAQLVDGCRNERLAAKTGVYRHDENEINQVDDMLDARYRCSRVQGDTGLLAQAADCLQRAMNVRTSFDVNRDYVRAGFRESLKIWIAWRDH